MRLFAQVNLSKCNSCILVMLSKLKLVSYLDLCRPLALKPLQAAFMSATLKVVGKR